MGPGGRLVFVDQKKRGTYRFPFVRKEGKFALTRSALFPVLAAFRWMVDVDPKNGQARWAKGFEATLKLWRQVGGELMRATQATSEDVGRKANAIGRSRNHWPNLHNIVAKRSLMSDR